MASRTDAATAEYEAFEFVAQGIIADPRSAWRVWQNGPRAPTTNVAWVGRYVEIHELGQAQGGGSDLVLWSARGGMRCLVVEHEYRIGSFGVGWAHRRRDGTWLLDEERRASWRWNNDDRAHRRWEAREERPEQWVLEPKMESFRVVSNNRPSVQAAVRMAAHRRTTTRIRRTRLMGLDADIGWLWRASQPARRHPRIALEPEIDAFDRVEGALRAADLPAHREPRWPDPRPPGIGRIGFGSYSGIAKPIAELLELAAHVARTGQVPRTRAAVTLDYPAATSSPTQFNHLRRCAFVESCVLVPVAFDAVLSPAALKPGAYRRIGSSVALERECRALLNLYSWYDEQHPDFDWLLEYGESPELAGMRERIQQPHEFGVSLSLLVQLHECAQRSLTSCCALTFC